MFILPAFILFLFYTLYPIIDIVITSFKRESILTDSGFVGLENWKYILNDEIIRNAFKNTFIVVGGELILMLPLGFLLGFILYTKFRGAGVVKTVTFVPYILSPIMVAIVWTFILDPGIGLINGYLIKIGLKQFALQWIGGTTLTPYSVILVDTWKAVGFYGILVFTGLKMLPKDTLEAAIVDGASRIQRTIYVTLPLMKETIKLCAVMIIIGAFQSFQTVIILTNGGPSERSQVLASYMLKVNFLTKNFGLGSAMSVVLFVFIMGFSISVLALSNKKVGE